MTATGPVLALLLLLGTAAEAAAAEAATVERSIDVDGRPRSYLIHVPASWDGRAALPVVFVFHGAGSDAESMVRATGLDGLADRERFLVVYPRAAKPLLRYEVDPGPPGTTSPDVRFVESLLHRLRGRFPVDERRIHATGFSNGAAFCYRLAAQMPSTFAAIAPVAGYLPAGIRRGPATPVALLHAHGTRDDRVSLSSTGARGVLQGVATWASWSGCSGSPVGSDVPEAAPLSARRHDYPGCPTGAAVRLLLFEGRGHEWAGGPDGVLTREMWQFFRAHPRVVPSAGARATGQ